MRPAGKASTGTSGTGSGAGEDAAIAPSLEAGVDWGWAQSSIDVASMMRANSARISG